MTYQETARQERKKLTLKKETLRRLTSPDLRLVAGGIAYTTFTTVTKDITKKSMCQIC
jgi:hypothetical protein